MPSAFADSCFEEVMCVIAGGIKRYNKVRQQTRLLMYTISATVTPPEKRGEVFDVFHIPGDPTEEERRQQLIEQTSEMVKANKEFTDMIRAEKLNEKK